MLLFITRKYPPSVGGMERLSHRLTAEISKREEVRIISWGRSQRWLPFFLLSAFLRAIWTLRRETITLIHIGDPLLAPLGVLLRLLGKVPVVSNAHGLDVIYPHPLYQLVIPWWLRQLDCVVCISDYTRGECLRRGISEDRCVVIPPGIDVDEYTLTLPPETRRRLALDWELGLDGQHVLLTVGRLVRRKGVAPFVRQALPLLCERREDWIYLVVGEGPERAAIEAAVEAHGLTDKVRLLGRICQAELKVVYALADLFLMPNVPVAGDAEGFGLVSLEARAAGLPVVAANLEGIAGSIENEEDGVLVSPEDYTAYVQAIDRLLGREPSAAEQQRRRERVAARFGWSHIAVRYLHLFRRVQAAYEKQTGGSIADRD